MVELIFSHIPKAAGKSIVLGLKQYYGADAVAEDYNVRVDGASDPGAAVYVDEQEYQRHAETFVRTTVSPKTKVIAGHFPFHKYRSFFPRANQVCCIREPIERLWSTYWYWKQVGPTTSPIQALVATGKLNFKKLIGHPMMRNQQVDHFLSGARWDEWPEHDPEGVFVMCHEYLEAGWKMLGSTLGAKSRWPDLPHINKTDHKEEISEEEWIEAFRLNGRDYDL